MRGHRYRAGRNCQPCSLPRIVAAANVTTRERGECATLHHSGGIGALDPPDQRRRSPRGDRGSGRGPPGALWPSPVPLWRPAVVSSSRRSQAVNGSTATPCRCGSWRVRGRLLPSVGGAGVAARGRPMLPELAGLEAGVQILDGTGFGEHHLVHAARRAIWLRSYSARPDPVGRSARGMP